MPRANEHIAWTRNSFSILVRTGIIESWSRNSAATISAEAHFRAVKSLVTTSFRNSAVAALCSCTIAGPVFK